MEILVFCARDVRDYFPNNAAIKKAELSFEERQALLNHKQVQATLQNLMSGFPTYKAGCECPIYGETGIDGLKIDFNFGLRLDVPAGSWHIKIGDYDSGMIFFDAGISDIRLISVEKYYIRWFVEAYRDGELVFSHILDLNNQPVQIFTGATTLGDTLAYLPHFREFQKRHNCKVTARIAEYIREFFKRLYPDIKQSTQFSWEFYATYYPIVPVSDIPFLPVDARNEPLDRMAGIALGLNSIAPKAKFKPTESRQIKQRYVCISVQTSQTKKSWLYPNGWDIVVKYLQNLGYRVLCIDKEIETTNFDMTVRKPEQAEDFTGNRSIMERANMLYYADFFIGLGSGLSWLADAVGCPVILIAGFSRDWYEFYTPYRVMNPLTCTGCMSDLRARFFKDLCPYHKGTNRELECQKSISPQQVINAIDRIIADRKLKVSKKNISH